MDKSDNNDKRGIEETIAPILLTIIILVGAFYGTYMTIQTNKESIRRELYNNYNQIYEDEVIDGIISIRRLYLSDVTRDKTTIQKASEGLKTIKTHPEITNIPRLGYANDSVEEVQQYIDSCLKDINQDIEYENAKKKFFDAKKNVVIKEKK